MIIPEKISQHKDIICDSCGKSCGVHFRINEDPKEPYDKFEYMTLIADWGYFSSYDFQKWTAHICEQCVNEKLSFIKFSKTNTEPFSDIPVD